MSSDNFCNPDVSRKHVPSAECFELFEIIWLIWIPAENSFNPSGFQRNRIVSLVENNLKKCGVNWAKVAVHRFELMLHYAVVAVLLHEPSHHQQTEPRRLLGLIVVTDSRFTRSAHPTSCQLLLVTASQLSGRQVHAIFNCSTGGDEYVPHQWTKYPTSVPYLFYLTFAV